MKTKSRLSFVLFALFVMSFVSCFVSFSSKAAFSVRTETHVHNYAEKIIEPTCTERGYTKHTCTICNDSYNDMYIRPTGHNVKFFDAVLPTCTESGKTAGALCTVCGETLKGLETTPPLGHEMISDKNALKPTCTQGGRTASEHCKRCDLKTPSKTLSPLGHDIVKDAAKKPTCMQKGKTEGEHCSRCDYKISQEAIPALGHYLVTDEAVKATCTESGLTSGQHCTRCSYQKVQNVIAPLGHKIIKDEEKKATCTSPGLTKGEHCTRCDYFIGRKTIPALGHDIVFDAERKPTCTEKGLTKGEHCTRCNYKIAQKSVPALGHSIVTDAAKKPTCTEPGLTKGEHCTRCSHKILQSRVPALGHNLVVDKAKKATCEKTGLTEGNHCTRCDFKTEQKVLRKRPHSFKKSIKKASFSSDGEITEKCVSCGFKSKKLIVVPMIDSAVLSKTKFIYNGKSRTPVFIVKDRNGKKLNGKTDYTVTYYNNKKVGKATAKITFKGNYSGSKTLSFRILPAAPKSLSAVQTSSVIKAKWSRCVGASGYKVYLYKNGKCSKTIDTQNTSAVFGNIKSDANYKVVVKAYTMIGKSKAISFSKKSVAVSGSSKR